MRDFLVQFPTPGAPSGWQAFDLFAGGRIPPRPVIAAAYQGVVFEGYDRMVVRVDGEDLVVAGVCDDVAWAGKRWARIVRFGPLAPDPAFGGAYNTRPVHELYAEGASLAALQAIPGAPWGQIAPFLALPALPGQILPGALLSDADFTAHQAARELRGWREWTHGVPANLLDERGHLVRQRVVRDELGVVRVVS